jgi:hypothetical protein
LSTDPDGVEQPRPLACPTCARKYPLSERFCPDCEMPLIYAGRGEEEPVTEAHERARKVKPQYLGGELVKVAFAKNLAEAQLIQGILLEEGIPSIERRTRGFDVPDFLAGGPRDILVPEAGSEAARELLDNLDPSEAPAPAEPQADSERALRLLFGMLAVLAIGAAVVWALTQVV